MSEPVLPSSSDYLIDITGIGGFYRQVKYNVIYTGLKVNDFIYNLNANVESLSGIIWHYIENCTVKFLLLTGLHLSKAALRKTYRFCNSFPFKCVVVCVVILRLCYRIKRYNFWKPRKIALLWKGSEQSIMNNDLKNIEKHIISRLQQELRNEGIRLDENPWDQALDVGRLPVIVFCVLSSRIGTDIENAMKGVHGNSQVILVLQHSVLSGLLRGDLSDNEELLDATMRKRMTGIAHFAFSDREGLYACYQNTVGFRELRYTIRFLQT